MKMLLLLGVTLISVDVFSFSSDLIQDRKVNVQTSVEFLGGDENIYGVRARLKYYNGDPTIIYFFGYHRSTKQFLIISKTGEEEYKVLWSDNSYTEARKEFKFSENALCSFGSGVAELAKESFGIFWKQVGLFRAK